MYFLDSNAHIHASSGRYPKLTRRLAQVPASEISIPSVVAAELYYGAEKSSHKEASLEILRAFFTLYKIVPFDARAAAFYGSIRRQLERQGRPIGGNDMMIAAIVLSHNGTLVTNNVREFSRVEGLQIEDWSQG